MNKRCNYCPYPIDTETKDGWGFMMDGVKIVYWHTECFEISNNIALERA